jgi:hypothetical protein
MAACTVRDPGDSTSTGDPSTGPATNSSPTVPTTGGDATTSADPTTTDATVTTGATEPMPGTIGTSLSGTSTGDVEMTVAMSDATTEPVSTTDTTATTDTTDTTEGETGVGECEINADCASKACLEFRDHDPDAVCVAGPGGGRTRFPGTVLDLTTGEPVPATDVKVIGLLDALIDPMGAQGVVVGTADAAGVVDMTSDAPVVEGIGVAAVVGGGPLFTTCTGVASPTNGQYGPMSDRHDIWAVPSATLTAWTGFLMKEPALAADLPLGEKGGTLGVVRDDTGTPIAGAVVESVNPDSKAKIRYLADDLKGFNSVATGGSGIFVVLAPALAEQFEVVGAPEARGTAGSANQAIFVMALDLP